jgi:eukaryotic-like serine/threonine-protein kinase
MAYVDRKQEPSYDAAVRSASMTAPTPSPGVMLGHFRLIEEIGAGGMGDVFRARDTHLERDVAVKVLNSKTLSSNSARKRFRHEALMLSRLNHPNIESVYDFRCDDGIDYLVLEYVRGVSLSERLEKGALPEKEVLSVGIQLARGLAAAHAQRILHRDLKPGNLKLTPENVLKILDFGLAQLFALPEDKTLTVYDADVQHPPRAGTPPYLSPEQIELKEPDTRSDIYSAGTVLYELATRSRPFPYKGQMLADAILHALPPSPRLKNKDISLDLESVILKCLEKDPRLRYQTANQLLEDLKELARGPGPHRLVAAQRRADWRSKRWLVLGLVLAVVLTASVTFRNTVLEWVSILPPVPTVKHVAVLPFHMTGAQPQEVALFEGLTDTVTNRLMQLTAAQPVGIVPCSEINANHVTTMQEARGKLGANLAVDGSVQRHGDQLQINLALSDIASHKQLRADSVTGTTGDFKRLEEQVVDTAVRMLELELHKNPPKDEAHATTSQEAYEAFVRGRGYLSRSSTPENADSAIAEFTRALGLDPGYAAAYASLGRGYWLKYQLTKDQQWLPKMRDACETSLQLAPSSAEGNICMGMVDAGAGNYEQAASELQRAISSDPTNALAYRKLASAYESLGRREQAERTYKNGIEVHPEDPSSYAALGTFYDGQARYDQAVAQFEKAVSLAPDVAEYRSSLGGTYLFAGVYPKAENALQRAIRLQPSYAAYSNLGQTFFLERKFEEAIAAFEEATILGKRQIQSHGNLARAYYWYPPQHRKAKSELEKAIELSDAALRINPNDADVHTLVAEYFAMLGQRDQALEHLQTAMELRPGDPETEYYAAKVYNLLGNREQALNWLEKSVNSGYSPAEINNTVELDSLRKEARFQSLGQKLHG